MDELDVESLGLPEIVIIPDEYAPSYEDDVISDWLSDEYGFCHEGFELIYLTGDDMKTEEENLKRAVNNASVDAVEEFWGHQLDNDAIDIWSEMNDVIAQMLDEEYLKYLAKYCK